MKITSPAFEDNTPIPAKYTPYGANASPPLDFTDVSPMAKSLALVCHDPDAPHAEGWTHWVVWNIAPDAKGFAEDYVPKGAVQGVNDGGKNGWSGPQPPSGTHHYVFYLFAIDTTLTLSPGSGRQELESAINGHIVETATLTGLFSA